MNVWKHAEKFKALGITLQNNGETNLTWEDTEKQAWRIFYRVARHVDCKSLAARYRVKLLNMHVFPFLAYRMSSTPLTDTRLYQVQKL